VRWFGESWGAPVCDPKAHTETPVGAICLYCPDPIESDDQGFVVPHLGEADESVVHRACLMHSILGYWPV
jgi:hypothetical protein